MGLERLTLKREKAIKQFIGFAKSKKDIKSRQLFCLLKKCGIEFSNKKGKGSHKTLLTETGKPICYNHGPPISIPTKFGSGTLYNIYSGVKNYFKGKYKGHNFK